MKIITAEYTEKPDVERIKKWQLYSPHGWPGGVDPYPNQSEEDVVIQIVLSVERKVEAWVVEDKPLKLGQTVTICGKEFVVVDITRARMQPTKIIGRIYPD